MILFNKNRGVSLLNNNIIPSAVIYGYEGLIPTEAELAFFKDVNPLGFILFARNIDNPEQVKRAVKALKACVGWECPILIDQEGGRVARLKPPHWGKYPAVKTFADIYTKNGKDEAKEAVYYNYRLLGEELYELGINVDCAPVMDLLVEGAHDIIGDRSFGSDPKQVAELAIENAKGLIDSGVLPIIKHIPGHGRALVDSHEDLPTVDTSLEVLQQTDFASFKYVADKPWWAMTAHIVYNAVDDKLPATQSPKMIKLIRDDIGFDGFLISDDLSMKALKGTFKEKAEKSLDAGCDAVLHCNGNMEEMLDVAKGVKPLTESARVRLEKSLSVLKAPEDLNKTYAESLLKKAVG